MQLLLLTLLDSIICLSSKELNSNPFSTINFGTMRPTNGIYFLFFSKLNLLFFFVVVLFSVMKADLNPYQMYFFQTSKKAFIEMGCFTSSTRKRSEFAVFLLIIFLHLDQERSKYGDIVRSAV